MEGEWENQKKGWGGGGGEIRTKTGGKSSWKFREGPLSTRKVEGSLRKVSWLQRNYTYVDNMSPSHRETSWKLTEDLPATRQVDIRTSVHKES